MSKPVRIAIFLMTSNNDYQTLEKEGCRSAARKHQFSVRELSAHNDIDRQLAQIRECLAEPEAIRPRALIVFPVIESLLRPVAEEAARLGVAFVLLNRSCAFMEELRLRHPTVPIVSVMPDQQDIGRIQGRQFARLLPNGGELLYIQGTFLTSAARLRLAGVRETLAGLSIRSVMEQGDWSTGSGAAAVQRWLRARMATTVKDCVVGAQNDDMAMGARAALVEAAVELKQPELSDIPVTGCDGTGSQGQVWVRDKELAATVVMPPTAAKAVEVLAQAFETGKAPPGDIEVDEKARSFPDLELIGAPEPTKSAPRILNARSKALSVRG
ncbi:MAG: sugar ABC transporter substrate-binding protein [Polyangiaceae bacterium]